MDSVKEKPCWLNKLCRECYLLNEEEETEHTKTKVKDEFDLQHHYNDIDIPSKNLIRDSPILNPP